MKFSDQVGTPNKSKWVKKHLTKSYGFQIKRFCYLVLWTKVTLELEGLDIIHNYKALIDDELCSVFSEPDVCTQDASGASAGT